MCSCAARPAGRTASRATSVRAAASAANPAWLSTPPNTRGTCARNRDGLIASNNGGQCWVCTVFDLLKPLHTGLLRCTSCLAKSPLADPNPFGCIGHWGMAVEAHVYSAANFRVKRRLQSASVNVSTLHFRTIQPRKCLCDRSNTDGFHCFIFNRKQQELKKAALLADKQSAGGVLGARKKKRKLPLLQSQNSAADAVENDDTESNRAASLTEEPSPAKVAKKDGSTEEQKLAATHHPPREFSDLDRKRDVHNQMCDHGRLSLLVMVFW